MGRKKRKEDMDVEVKDGSGTMMWKRRKCEEMKWKWK